MRVLSVGGGANARTLTQVDVLGRAIEVTDPVGNVTFNIYNDADHEVTTYAGWNSDTDQTTGPIQRTQWFPSGGGYTDTLSYYSSSVPVSGGVPLGTESITTLVALSEDIDNVSDQTMQSLVYFNVASAGTYGMFYSPGTPEPGSVDAISGGTLVGNYYETEYQYGYNGDQVLVTDPSGTMTQTVEDLLGRVTSTWVGTALPSGGEAFWSPTNAGNFVEVSASIYGASGVSPELLTESVKYPGGSGTAQTTFYDSVSGGSGINTSIKSIATTYDNMWHAAYVTSYSTTTVNSADIVNQVENITDGYGNLIGQYQSASGAVSGGTPEITYGYAPLVSGGAEQLAWVSYPDGQVYDYAYALASGYASGGTSGGEGIFTVDSGGIGSGAPGMLVGITDPALAGAGTGLDSLNQAVVQAYTMLGNGTLVAQQSAYGPGWTAMSGGAVTGLDPFGRTSEIKWVGSGGSVVVDLKYAYTSGGDVASIRDLVNTSQSKLYTYDSLHEVTSMQEGTMNSGGTALSGGTSYSETDWKYDSLGNVNTLEQYNGTVGGSVSSGGQSWGANDQNELTTISGGEGTSTLAYNSGGATTTNSAGDTLVYDAWGRLVSVYSGATLIASYTYNGLNERVTETTLVDDSDVTTMYIYSAQGQVLEEMVGDTVTTQNLWGADYVNDLVMMKHWDGSGYQILWVQHDANYDVVSACLQGGTLGSSSLVERYDYTPFGVQTVFNSGGSVLSGGTVYGVDVGFQGMEYDLATKLYFTANRVYDAVEQRWLTPDPTGLAAGDVNLYRTEGNNPILRIDPSGDLWNVDVQGDAWNFDQFFIKYGIPYSFFPGQQGNIYFAINPAYALQLRNALIAEGYPIGYATQLATAAINANSALNISGNPNGGTIWTGASGGLPENIQEWYNLLGWGAASGGEDSGWGIFGGRVFGGIEGGLCGAGGTIIGLFLVGVNIWNPIGWAGATILLGAGGGAVLGGWYGGDAASNAGSTDFLDGGVEAVSDPRVYYYSILFGLANGVLNSPQAPPEEGWIPPQGGGNPWVLKL